MLKNANDITKSEFIIFGESAVIKGRRKTNKRDF